MPMDVLLREIKVTNPPLDEKGKAVTTPLSAYVGLFL